jgi:hypothetical protein
LEIWRKPQDVENLEVWDSLGRNPLERVDAIVLEISKNDSQVNYLLAQAILLQKNTLCVYKKNTPPRAFLMYLHKKNVPRCIQFKAYNDKTLQSVLHNYLNHLKPSIALEEVPYIKFTLRITDSIEKYLNWKSTQQKKNKADLIRDDIKKQMDEDAQYKKFLQKHKRNLTE